MPKRIRNFKRIAFKAKTGQEILHQLSERTFKDHEKKCIEGCILLLETPCRHMTSRNLDVAELVKNKLTISKTRAHLDIPDPYSTEDYADTIEVLKMLARRLLAFAETQSHPQQKKAWQKIAKEVKDYADRNPLEVLADCAD